MKAIIIGRFQPVHLGHIGMVQELDTLKEQLGIERIILGIGTAGRGRTQRNPFSYDEVKEMWIPELEKLSIPYDVYEIPDINNKQIYAKHVEDITGCDEKDTILISGNPYTTDCFTQYGRMYEVYEQSPNYPVGDKYLCATMVREMIRDGVDWQEFVPESARKVIDRIDGVRIVRELYQMEGELNAK